MLRIAAAAHLVILEGGDPAALVFLEGFSGISMPPYLFYDYLELYTEIRHWSRLHLWLAWLRPRMAYRGTLDSGKKSGQLPGSGQRHEAIGEIVPQSENAGAVAGIYRPTPRALFTDAGAP